ncbi:UNVERIFIED_CONTAM: hypothetical protein Sindi_0016800 [Sesamum indicum]
MDSPKTLCSLTHTSTPQDTHTSHDGNNGDAVETTENAGEEDEAVDDRRGEEVNGGNGISRTVRVDGVGEAGRSHLAAGSMDSVRASFNIVQFLTLVHKVIDNGDHASFEALENLKKKWEQRFGPIPLHVDGNPLMRGFRMARQHLLCR